MDDFHCGMDVIVWVKWDFGLGYQYAAGKVEIVLSGASFTLECCGMMPPPPPPYVVIERQRRFGKYLSQKHLLGIVARCLSQLLISLLELTSKASIEEPQTLILSNFELSRSRFHH